MPVPCPNCTQPVPDDATHCLVCHLKLRERESRGGGNAGWLAISLLAAGLLAMGGAAGLLIYLGMTVVGGAGEPLDAERAGSLSGMARGALWLVSLGGALLTAALAVTLWRLWRRR